MSERLAPKQPRDEFPLSVRNAALARAGGLCEGDCGRALVRGQYTFDHTVPTRLGGPATLGNCKVLCSGFDGSCNSIKTYREDLPGIAAIKRYGKNRLPLDISRPVKQPPKMRGRSTFQKGGKIPSRPFQKRAK